MISPHPLNIIAPIFQGKPRQGLGKPYLFFKIESNQRVMCLGKGGKP